MFTTAGTYNVSLTVTNSLAKTDSVIKQVIVTSGGGTPTTVTLQEGVDSYTGTEDTYVVGGTGAGESTLHDEWYGNNQYLRTWYSGGGAENQTTFIKFDLSSVTPGTLTGATLRMWIRRENMAPDDLQIHLPTADWTEQTTWNTKPGMTNTGQTFTFPDTAFGTTISDPPTTYVDVDLSALLTTVDGWITSPSTNYGLAFVATTDINADFWSSEYATAQYRPQLTLEFSGGGGPSDTTPPVINVTHAVLTGTVNDAVSTPTSILVEGSTVGVTAGNWVSGSIPVPTLPYTIDVDASDASSNTTSIDVIITSP